MKKALLLAGIGLMVSLGCNSGNGGSPAPTVAPTSPSSPAKDGGGESQPTAAAVATDTPISEELLQAALLQVTDLPGEWTVTEEESPDSDDPLGGDDPTGCTYLDEMSSDDEEGFLGMGDAVLSVDVEYTSSILGPFLRNAVSQFGSDDDAEDGVDLFREISRRCGELRSANDDGTVTVFTVSDLEVGGDGDRAGLRMSSSTGLFNVTVAMVILREAEFTSSFIWLGLGDEISESFIQSLADTAYGKIRALSHGTLTAAPATTETSKGADSEDEVKPAEPEVGSRTAPVPMGEAAEVGPWSVRVVETTPNATEDVLAANPFNDPPADGRQFFIARLEATRVGDGSGSFWAEMTIEALDDADVVYDYQADCGVVPDEITSAGEVFQGGVIEGNVCWEVRSDLVDSLLILLEESFSFDETRVFLATQATR